MSKRKDEIICPYCNHLFIDPYKYYDQKHCEIECENCKKEFLLQYQTEIIFSTKRLDCDEIGEEHDWDNTKTIRRIVSQQVLDRLIAERNSLYKYWIPHNDWSRQCKKCGENEHKYTDMDDPVSPFTNKSS